VPVIDLVEEIEVICLFAKMRLDRCGLAFIIQFGAGTGAMI
jgi:hypothetical protein